MFSNSTKYAIRAVIFLYKNRYEDKKYRVEELASTLQIPKPYLSKVLQELSRNKIVSSTKGRGGGFFLTDENVSRRLMDVIECMEGYNVFDKCILGLPQCGDINPCALHPYFKLFKTDINRAIKDTSIKDLEKLTKGNF